MEITLKDTPKQLKEITAEEYNVCQINDIGKKYPDLRQKSKY